LTNFIRKLLTDGEIVEALERLGCIDIKLVDINGQLDSIKAFVIGTGTSTRHIQKMSDVIVKAVSSIFWF
jgi:ribosomal silencing factor RsfS